MPALWVYQEGCQPDEAIKIALPEGAYVIDALEESAQRFVWTGNKLLPSQLQLHACGKHLSNRELLKEFSPDDTYEVRAKPGVLEDLRSFITMSSMYTQNHYDTARESECSGSLQPVASLYVASPISAERSAGNLTSLTRSSSSPLKVDTKERTASASPTSASQLRLQMRRSSSATPTRRAFAPALQTRHLSSQHDTPRLRMASPTGHFASASPTRSAHEDSAHFGRSPLGDKNQRTTSHSPKRGTRHHEGAWKRRSSPPAPERRTRSMMFSKPMRPQGSMGSMHRSGTSSVHDPPRRTASPPRGYGASRSARSRVFNTLSIPSSSAATPQTSARGQRQLDEFLMEIAPRTSSPTGGRRRSSQASNSPEAGQAAQGAAHHRSFGSMCLSSSANSGRLVQNSSFKATANGPPRRSASDGDMRNIAPRTSASAPAVPRRVYDGTSQKGDPAPLRDADVDREELANTMPQRRFGSAAGTGPQRRDFAGSFAARRTSAVVSEPAEQVTPTRRLGARARIDASRSAQSSSYTAKSAASSSHHPGSPSHLSLYSAPRSKSVGRALSHTSMYQRRSSQPSRDDAVPPMRLPSFMKYNWQRRPSAPQEDVSEDILRRRRHDEQRRKEVAARKRRDEARRLQSREAEEEERRWKKMEEDYRRKYELEALRKQMLQRDTEKKRRARRALKRREDEEKRLAQSFSRTATSTESPPPPPSEPSELLASGKSLLSTTVSSIICVSPPGLAIGGGDGPAVRPDSPTPAPPSPVSPVQPTTPKLRDDMLLPLAEELDEVRCGVEGDEDAGWAALQGAVRHAVDVDSLVRGEVAARGVLVEGCREAVCSLSHRALAGAEGIERAGLAAQYQRSFSNEVVTPFQATYPQPSPYNGKENFLVVMRHSIRLDKDGWECAPLSLWPDKASRPYDPPISDFDLPKAAARNLKVYRIQTIVSSPFRRCLQTAGVVARTLGLRTVHVDDRLGEWYREVARCCTGANLPVAPAKPLSVAEAQAALGADVSLGDWTRATIGPPDTAGLVSRVSQCVPQLAKRYSPSNVLLCTHGDIANRYLPEAEFIEEYSYIKLHEAGYVVLRGPHTGRSTEDKIVDQFRTEFM